MKLQSSSSSYYEDVGISHETSMVRTPQQKGIVKRRNYTLVEAARTMLIYAKALLFLWAEAIATACFTQNRKLKAKADVGIFIGYAPAKKAYQIYNRYTRQIMETIHVNFDELIVMASEQSSSGPALYEMTLRTLIAAPVPAVSTGLPSSTLVDQDAPSPSTSQTPQASPSHVFSPGAEEADHDIEVADMENNPQFGFPIP
ncbi:retrovirus-related pol polyprotein from transposon TNT 1-94 [Tanacetum coccineum]